MPAVNDFDTEEPATFETPQAPVTNGKPLQVTKLCNGSIMLFNANCFDVLPHLKANTVNMVFADLPYGQTTLVWDKLLNMQMYWQAIKRVTKLTTPIVMTAIQPFTSLLIVSNLPDYRYNWVWYKNQPTAFQLANIQPMRAYEDIAVFYRKQCVFNKQLTRSRVTDRKFGGKNGTRINSGNHVHIDVETQITLKEFVNPRNVLEIPIEPMSQGRLHPTQKPVELLEYLIKTYTNEGDLVLDPTMGSGTTAVACKHLNRRCIGIELDQTYFNIAVNRVINE